MVEITCPWQRCQMLMSHQRLFLANKSIATLRCASTIWSRARIDRCAVAFLLASILGACSFAETVHFGHAYGTDTRDTMIFENNVENAAGGAPGFFAGSNSQPSPRRGLISFDVSDISKNAAITSVELRLVVGQLAGSGGGSNPPGTYDPVIGLHKLLVSWGEADTGQSNASVLNGTGQGNSALPGDATWNARIYDPITPTLWAEPGGQSGVEFSAMSSASLQQPNKRYEESIWQSAAALVTDVQTWVDDSESNYGWMLINTDEASRQTFRGFFSHDYNPASLPTDIPVGSPLGSVSDFWPVLTVTYEPRTPGDFDYDGDVDGRDFLLWQRDPSIGELADWQSHHDVNSVSASWAIPEPSCLVLISFAVGSLLIRLPSSSC